MQHCLARQGRTKSHILLAQSGPRKCQTLGCQINKPKMSQSNVRWAFNFSKWDPGKNAILSSTSCIQSEEKERLMKFVFKKDFKASLIGRLMMRKFVSDYNNQGIKYNEIKFERDLKGKPILGDENLKSLTFNVSHQGHFTVLAGHVQGGLLGVDVARIESPRMKNFSLDDYFNLMRRIFSQNEWDTIKSEKDENDQLKMFYRHWCLKESYLKAVGIGITINLQDVSFRINSKILKTDAIVTDTEVFFKNQKQEDWHFQESLLNEDHCVAVASNIKNDTVLFKEIDFEELMRNAVPLLPTDELYCGKFFEKSDK